MGDSRETASAAKRFTGDRYERLRQAAAVLAQDPAVAQAEYPFNGDGLHFLVADIARHRIFDGLGERDADVVTMLLLLDFHLGPRQLAARIQDALEGCANDMPPTTNPWAVMSGLAAVLALMADTIARLPATLSEAT